MNYEENKTKARLDREAFEDKEILEFMETHKPPKNMKLISISTYERNSNAYSQWVRNQPRSAHISWNKDKHRNECWVSSEFYARYC